MRSFKIYIFAVVTVLAVAFIGSSILQHPEAPMSETVSFQAYLNWGVRNWSVRLDQDYLSLQKALEEIGEEVYRPVKHNGWDPHLQQPISGHAGWQLDVDAALERLTREMGGGRFEVELPITRIEPQSVDLPDGTPFQLASFSTTFDPEDTERTHNIRLAAYSIHGQVVQPHEEFSFNDLTGPTSHRQGYEEATVIMEREFVPGIGGGVCQVSSTLYNAALLSGMEITERRNHSRPVSYLPLGRDAAVYFGQLDFRFRNPHAFPVVVSAQVDEGSIAVEIFGSQSMNAKYEIVVKDPQVLHFSTVEKADPSLPVGARQLVQEGRDGYLVAVDRIVSRDGTKKSERVSNDTYPPIEHIVAKNP